MKKPLISIILFCIMAIPLWADDQDTIRAAIDSAYQTTNLHESYTPCDVVKEFGEGKLKNIDLDANGIPTNLFGDLNIGITATEPLEKSYQLFEIHKGIFKINPREELQYVGAITRDGFISTTVFDQIHDGIKIEGGQYAIHFNRNGTLNGANGNLFPEARQINGTPTVSKEQAQQTAEADYKGLKMMGRKMPDPELLIHRHRGKFYLCWKVFPGLEYNYYVDAHSGEIVGRAPAMSTDPGPPKSHKRK
jgi:Zn-dependent metalloprotease